MEPIDALPENEVHVWCASLDTPEVHVESLFHILDTDELNRASRFYFERDRKHFIAGRGLLRVLLGYYLGAEPACLRFSYNYYGKPALIPLPNGNKLNFNLSHSNGMVLYAFTRNGEIGVDIERIRTNLAWEQLAERVFSPQEVTTLHALPAWAKLEAFFHGWTRKEAYIKARGKGLSLRLDSFDVSLSPGEPAKLLASREDPQAVTRWTFQDIVPAPNYVATVVVEGQGQRVNHYRLDADVVDSCLVNQQKKVSACLACATGLPHDEFGGK